jgi:hypothetical protein
MTTDPSSPAVPAPAVWLGAAGVLPFAAAVLVLVVPSAGLSLVSPGLAATALTAYGAVILSFLGGVHWGAAVTGPSQPGLTLRLSLSVLPSLVGWLALLLPHGLALPVLAGGFLAMLAVDLRAARLSEVPAWYPRLRIPLTLVVTALLLAGAAFLP